MFKRPATGHPAPPRCPRRPEPPAVCGPETGLLCSTHPYPRNPGTCETNSTQQKTQGCGPLGMMHAIHVMHELLLQDPHLNNSICSGIQLIGLKSVSLLVIPFSLWSVEPGLFTRAGNLKSAQLARLQVLSIKWRKRWRVGQ